MVSELPPRDKEGYLRDLTSWTPGVAEALAAEEDIMLTAAHWEVLNLLRAFHARHKLAPNNRALVKAVGAELGPERGRSLHLMLLFGGSFAKTAARIAGLPRPTHCL
ncbi:MAG: TusE/DsrC/DsvC family sulfur relay protein [Gammaproteobacteria bacterium]|nr:TusE/DsrC/DsvC family sulfur relay protein [Gammaproteobacteria bacterium]